MWGRVYIGSFIAGWLFSVILTFLSGKVARRFNFISIPSSRSMHRHPTPLLGGLGIYLSFCLTIFAGFIMVRYGLVPDALKIYIPGITNSFKQVFAIILGGLAVVIFGVIDDKKALTARQKLLLQMIAVAIIFAEGIRLSFFLSNNFQSFILTAFWFLLMMNGFNLMDNMDGLSAGVAFISGSILFTFAVQMQQLFVATILAVFLGSVLGFLKHNFPPAKIFMGECGSSFLGYFLGTTAILLTFYRYDKSHTFLPVFAPLVIFSVLFFDTLSVIWIRKKRGLPISRADKNHLSHRLVALGMTQKQTVLFIYLLTLCTGIGALLLGSLNIFGGMIILFQVLIIIVIVGLLELTGRNREKTS